MEVSPEAASSGRKREADTQAQDLDPRVEADSTVGTRGSAADGDNDVDMSTFIGHWEVDVSEVYSVPRVCAEAKKAGLRPGRQRTRRNGSLTLVKGITRNQCQKIWLSNTAQS